MNKRNKNSLKLNLTLKEINKIRRKFKPDPSLDGKWANDPFVLDKLARANETLSKITNLDEIYK